MTNYDTEKLLRADEELLRDVEALPEEKSTQPPDPTEVGAGLLEDIIKFIRRYVWLTMAQAIVLALWVLHAHVFHVFEFTPYALITSPEKRCGKSRLMEVMQLLVPRPWGTSHATSAVLVRKIVRVRPCLFIDELDAALRGPKEYVETVRGILDEGDRRNGNPVSLCVKKGNDWVDKDFNVYCPKVLAGIGTLLETWTDRGIQIRLERKPRFADVERFRYRKAAAEGRALRERAKSWCTAKAKAFSNATAEMPDALNDRQQDHCEPLLIIAAALGGDSLQEAEKALIELCRSTYAEDQSHGVQLLRDIAGIFSSTKNVKLSSQELTEQLNQIETSPWAEFSHGKPLTKNGLAKLLKPFGIQPRTIRVDAQSTPRGYRLGLFVDAFQRYLPEVPQELLEDCRNDSALMREEEEPEQ